jgi:putative RecB family exonuclease
MTTALKLLRDEDHVSVSSLGTYLRCPRQYQYRYIDREPPESRGSALPFGSAIHAALAHFYQALKNDQPEPTAEELVAFFAEAWTHELRSDLPVLFGDNESAESLLATGTAMLRVFHEKAERPHRVVEVEMPFGVELSDPMTGEVLPRLVGVFDAVVQDLDGVYRILEHKTAARRWTEDRLRYDHQLTAYGLVSPLLGFGKARIDVQLLLKTKKADFAVYQVTRNEADERDFLEVVGGVTRAVRAQAFWPSRDWQCRSCEYASRCVAG